MSAEPKTESLAMMMARRAEHWFVESRRLLPDDASQDVITAAAHALGDFVMNCTVEDPHLRHIRSGSSIREEVAVYLRRGRRRIDVAAACPIPDLADRMLNGKGLRHRKFDLVNYLSISWGKEEPWSSRLIREVQRVAALPPRAPEDEEKARLVATRRKQARARLVRAVDHAVVAGMTAEEMYDLVNAAVVRPVMED